MVQTIGIRELMHHFARYLGQVKDGKSITIMERNTPVADLVPHNNNIRYPGWKRSIERIHVKGEPFSETVARERQA